MSRFQIRRSKLRKLLHRAGADAMLVTNFTNVTYLSGFTGDDSYLLLGRNEDLILSDPRYTTQLEEECPDVRLHIRGPGKSMLEAVAEAIASVKVSGLAVEGNSMAIALHQQICETVAPANTVVTTGLVEQLRQIKDPQEIEETRLAVSQAEKAFSVLRAGLRPEMTEQQVANDLEYQLRLFGAKGCSFPPIVAVGARAALPHARPTQQQIGAGDFVLVDWGATARHYKSDLTRVLVTGKILPKLKRVYDVVLRAQQRAIAAIRPGVSGRQVDAVARKIIADAGFEKRFGHGLGHGLGLDIHEAPRLSVANDRPLKSGMIVTVEPGIYIPGWGGVRIEDDVLVTKTGHEVLTSSPRKLSEVVVG